MGELQSLPPDLIEEYKLCQQKASSLSDNVWRTALILGIGSFAGIVSLSDKDAVPDDVRPWLTAIVSLFAIGVLLAWQRLARRWWSIEQVMFRRMEHIERQSQVRTNLYVGYRDGRVEFATNPEAGTTNQPFLNQELITDLDGIGNYEIRGVQPMMRFIVEINIAAWVVFALLGVAPLIQKTVTIDGPTAVRLTAVIAFAIWFIWRLVAHWRER